MGDCSNNSRAPSRCVTFHGLRSYLIQQNLRGTSCMNFSKRQFIPSYTEFPIFPQPVCSPRVIHEIPNNTIRRTMGGTGGTISVRIPGLCSPKIENPQSVQSTTVHRVFKISEGIGSIQQDQVKPKTPDGELDYGGEEKDNANSSEKSVSPVIATPENYCDSPEDANNNYSWNKNNELGSGDNEVDREQGQIQVNDDTVGMREEDVNFIPEIIEHVEQESDQDSDDTVLIPVELKEKLRVQLEARRAQETASSSSPSIICDSSPSSYSTSEPSPVSVESEPVSVRTRSQLRSLEHGVGQNRPPGRNKKDATAPSYYKDHHWKKLLLQSYLRAKLITDGEERAALALATRQATSRNTSKKNPSVTQPNKNPKSKTSSPEKANQGSAKADERGGERLRVTAKGKDLQEQDSSLPPRKRRAFRSRNK